MKADFRSDTITKPTSKMLEFMMKAPVGDDVFSEDPSINHLEAMMAEMFGMEAGIFCPSGTMTNQIAIKCHTQPGDEVICDKNSHIYFYEGGGISFNSSASVKLLDGDRGRVTAQQVKEGINPDDIHRPVSKLVSLENTCNRGGGSCYDFKDFLEIKKVCVENKLMLHLDGARIFNAIVAQNENPKEYGSCFDSISVCLSKGLGAPVGSVLLGNKDFIKKAKRIRKVMGGGMRQAGYLAAAGIYALEHHVDRLQEDHTHALMIEDALRAKPFVDKVLPVETNIVIASFHTPYTPQIFMEAMKKEDILMYQISPNQIRMVVHLDITPALIEKTIQAINKL
ncbi:MAG: aminotransferase class I/II-fold pyridoxal phosphate-dependent enzyme [Chitinophagaceae bacterium]|nr:aminotransferase class I/II-fold pyridoxal phosphate-dependent enzyme [Chitinophagaceae bacterium]